MADYNGILSALSTPQGYATDAQIKSLRDFDTSMQAPLPGMMRSRWQGIGDVVRSIMGGLAGRQASQYEKNNLQGGAAALPSYVPNNGAQPQQQGFVAPAPAPGGGDISGPSTPAINASPAELDRLTRAVMTEAGDQPLPGQIAVAQVAKNRVLTGGGTLGDVLTPEAFNGLKNADKIDPNSPQYQQTYKMVQGVASGQIPDTSHGSTHFYSPTLQAELTQKDPAHYHGDPAWSKTFQPTVTIGGHQFYQDPRAAGGIKAAQIAAAPQRPPMPLGPGGVPMPLANAPGLTQAAQVGGAPGGGGMPQPMPQGQSQPSVTQGGPGQMVPPMNPNAIQQLPTMEQIQELARNPQYHALALDLLKQRQQATTPAGVQTPQGQGFVYNPYVGGQQTPFPAQPQTIKIPEHIGEYSTEQQVLPIYDANNRVVGFRHLGVQGGSQAPGGAGGLPPFPEGGTVAQKMDWMSQAGGQSAARHTMGEKAGGMADELGAQADAATGTLQQTSEMRNLLKNINPNSGSEIKEVMGNALQGLGFSEDAVTKFLGTDPGDVQAFRKAATTLAAQSTKANFQRAAQQEFLSILHHGTPSDVMSPGGVSRVLDFMDKQANNTLEKQQAFVQYRKAHPGSDWQDFSSDWNKSVAERAKAGEFNTERGRLGGPQAQQGGPLPAASEGPQAGKPVLPDPFGFRTR